MSVIDRGQPFRVEAETFSGAMRVRLADNAKGEVTFI